MTDAGGEIGMSASGIGIEIVTETVTVTVTETENAIGIESATATAITATGATTVTAAAAAPGITATPRITAIQEIGQTTVPPRRVTAATLSLPSASAALRLAPQRLERGGHRLLTRRLTNFPPLTSRYRKT